MGCGGRDGGVCLCIVIQWKTNSHGTPLLVPTLFSPVYILYIQTGSTFNLSVWGSLRLAPIIQLPIFSFTRSSISYCH